ncbi:MAG: hypothetical protein AABX08_00710, partial [Nanoarchaeota archaeon]
GIDDNCNDLIDINDPQCLDNCRGRTCSDYPDQNSCEQDICRFGCVYENNQCINSGARDSDGDGVLDSIDQCYNPGYNGLVNNFGCPYRQSYNNILIEYPSVLKYADLNRIDRLVFKDRNNFVRFDYLVETSLIRQRNNEDEPLPIDTFLTIQKNKVNLNPNELPGLNKRARLIFFEVEFNNPLVLRDGAICSSCTLSFDIDTKILNVVVPGFSLYEVVNGDDFGGQGGDDRDGGDGGGGGSRSRQETPAYQCSDGIDNDNDGLIDYPSDSGCVSPIDNSELDIIECTENWICEDYGECVDGIRTRECYDFNGCGTTERMPATQDACEIDTFVPFEDEDRKGGLSAGQIIVTTLLISIVGLSVIIEEIIRRKRKNKV